MPKTSEKQEYITTRLSKIAMNVQKRDYWYGVINIIADTDSLCANFSYFSENFLIKQDRYLKFDISTAFQMSSFSQQ